ncbi:hypothetical protein [Streptomyces tendae]|uniref:hypothetical protein n=1 Tax=Streptomyces tendae TaxID=1932 RepID=UPI0036BF4C0C
MSGAPAHGQPAGDGNRWLCPRPCAREAVYRPPCTARDTQHAPASYLPCDGHDARRTFVFPMATNRRGLPHLAPTVGDLRKAVEGLGDDTARRRRL